MSEPPSKRLHLMELYKKEITSVLSMTNLITNFEAIQEFQIAKASEL